MNTATEQSKKRLLEIFIENGKSPSWVSEKLLNDILKEFCLQEQDDLTCESCGDNVGYLLNGWCPKCIDKANRTK